MQAHRPVTITVVTDSGVAAWAAFEDGHRPDRGDPLAVAGGVLTGDREVVAAIHEILDDRQPVRVIEPNGVYHFPPRDPASGEDEPLLSLVAAMIGAGRGRWRLDPPELLDDLAEAVFGPSDDDGDGDGGDELLTIY